MLTSNDAPNKRETLNIRIKPEEERSPIDRAAKARGKNRTDFILDAAWLATEEALLDRILVTVSPEVYAEFIARLDRLPEPLTDHHDSEAFSSGAESLDTWLKNRAMKNRRQARRVSL